MAADPQHRGLSNVMLAAVVLRVRARNCACHTKLHSLEENLTGYRVVYFAGVCECCRQRIREAGGGNTSLDEGRNGRLSPRITLF